MRRIFSIMCVCASLVLGVCSCSNDDDSKETDKRVALILPSDKTVDRWGKDAAYLSDALKLYGYEVKLYTADETVEGASLQVKQLEEAINAGITHFVITPIDYNTINNSKLLQNNQNCDFICYDRMIMDNSAVDFYTTCDPNKVGSMQALFLLQYIHAVSLPMEIEYFAGPETDKNAALYFNSAYSLLSAEESLKVPSGKKTYKEVALPSWSAEDAKVQMQNRIREFGIPDLILAPNDNVAEGIINALEEANCTEFPIITGQDLTSEAKQNIIDGKQAMTIYKEYEDLAKNTAMVVNNFILGKSPVITGKTFNNGAKEVPTMYSSITLVTKDNIDNFDVK